MPVDSETFLDMAKLADYYDADERFWTRPARKFRFKRQNHLQMGALHLMRRRDIITEHDGWQASTTTWTFTEHGERVSKRLEHSVLLEMNEKQRDLLDGSLDSILNLPLGKEFTALDYDLDGGTRKWLSNRGFITKVEERQVGSLWRATKLTHDVQAECVCPTTV